MLDDTRCVEDALNSVAAILGSVWQLTLTRVRKPTLTHLWKYEGLLSCEGDSMGPGSSVAKAGPIDWGLLACCFASFSMVLRKR